MQPVIGITTNMELEGKMQHGFDISYVPRSYARAVRAAGGQPILLESHIDPLVAAKMCDGIVISGGKDINPELYGQESRSDEEKAVRQRTDWERLLIDACDKYERPILGVCYGMQLLNVHYGGTLYQDIKDERGSNLFHGTIQAPTLQDVTFSHSFLGYAQGDTARGTHIHHQAVDRVAPGFTVVGRASDDGIEAIYRDGHYGIQWHAELDETASAIYGEFVKKCQTVEQPAYLSKPLSARVKRLSGLIARFR